MTGLLTIRALMINLSFDIAYAYLDFCYNNVFCWKIITVFQFSSQSVE